MSRLLPEPLLGSLKIQKNVISALLLREMITRYGRNNIGFLWLFLEPIIVMLFIAMIWGFRRNGLNGINVFEFLLTGYPLMMMWRGAANRCLGAVGANRGLFFHRNIRILDIYFTRVLLEVLGSTTAFIILFGIFYIAGLVSIPANLLYMVFAWILMAVFSLGLGLVIGILSEASSAFGRIWKAVGMVLMLSSGTFYFVNSLPLFAQKIALMIPMVHGTEMFRQGYFGNRVRTHEDILYILAFDIVLLLLGLTLVRKYGRGVNVL